MEILQRRKFCREFLNGYNEKLHPQIISRVFEIGLLTLKRKFNKLLFAKEELDEIIIDLSGKEYVEIVPLPPLKNVKKIEKLQNKNWGLPQENKEYNFTQENNDSNLHQTKIIRNHKRFEKTLQNPNFTTQNSEIYPNWWWNNKEEEIEKPKSQINIIYKDNEEVDNKYNNEEYINDNNIDYEYGEEENNYQNYQEEAPEMESSEIKNKNYTINKLTMNSSKPQKTNNYEDECYTYSKKEEKLKIIPNNKNEKKKQKNEIKKIKNERVKSSKPPCRKINSFNNKKGAMQKLIKKVDNNKDRKNLKLAKIPKYKYTYVNGKILRIPEEPNNHNLTTTEPNNKY